MTSFSFSPPLLITLTEPRHHENPTMSPTMTSSTLSSEDSMDLRRDPSYLVKTSGPPTQKRVSVAVHSRKASEPVKNFSLYTTKPHRRTAPMQDKKTTNGVSKERSRLHKNNLPRDVCLLVLLK
ncbi:hypothetical protein AHF37_05265 [Paragonimus kellicotti]|nr:hypothetical protein AHF37_05265 [Paragonimus kellicotti]